MNHEIRNLPRLLYLSDVPVESSYHGSTLIYRLLQNYPRDSVIIVEGNIVVSAVHRRLCGVPYATVRIGSGRLLHTRFARWYSSFLTLNAAGRARRLNRILADFQPQAVLTITHGFLWETAAQLAAMRNIPVHLICHDDWPRVTNVVGPFKTRVDRRFKSIYRQAASRLCVSPGMRDAYRTRYGLDGEVLYPCRAANCRLYEEPAPRLAEASRGLTVGFGGTINTPGYARALVSLAEILESVRGRLLIFGPLLTEDAHRVGLTRPNVELCGMLPSDELMLRFREKVDVLFVPMSFAHGDRDNMAMGFPAKLTDATAVGLPILIYGPPYCSAARWALENPGVAELVCDENVIFLAAAVNRLACDPAHRITLAQSAMNVGLKYFDHHAAEQILYQALRKH